MTHARALRLVSVCTHRAMIALAITGVGLASVGCSSSGTAARAVDQRPLVAQSAVESLGASADEGGLGFFDALESRPLASQDDAIHAALLLGTGSSAPASDQRVAMASALGYLPPDFARSPREAVTIGEVATMLAPIVEGRPFRSADSALSALRARGVVVGTGLPNQGLTGAQLMSIVGAMQDAMAAAGIQKVPAPVIPVAPPAAVPSAADVSTISAVDDRVPAALPSTSAALDTVGRNEPLPTIPPGKNPPAIDVQDPRSGKPAVIGPAGTPTSGPTTAPKPKPGVKLAPMPPAPGAAGEPKPATPNAAANPQQPETARTTWLRGQPLKPKSKPVDPNASPSPTTANADEPK